jgi:hypothetical protein
MNDPWFYSKTFFDLLQWFSVAWFNLTLFRINPKKYWLHSIFFALLCHFVPDVLSEWLNFPDLRTFFQISMEILCFWGVFMIPLFSSMVIALLGSVIILFLQIPIIGVIAFASRVSLQETVSNVFTYHCSIIIVILLTFLMSSYVSSKRLGFSFLTINHQGYQVKKEQKSLLLAMTGVLFAFMFFPSTLKELDMFVVVLIVITTITWFIFRQSMLRELDD